MEIFPQPQRIEFSDEFISLEKGYTLVTGEAINDVEKYAVEVLQKQLKASGIPEGGSFEIVLGTPKTNKKIEKDVLTPVQDVPNADQAYVLKVGQNQVILAGNESAGALYAVQSLVQILKTNGGKAALPLGQIVDWPDLKYRGIFSESRWNSELMTLQDWKDAIDLMSTFKFNIFNVGIANNWMIQYGGKRSEFLMVPIKKYPQFKTPKTVHYYSPKEGKDVDLHYLPTMFEEDFFGEVVEYGMKRGMIMRPHINTPGHNMMIPHAMPEISAIQEDGKPSGYCFCFSNPKTYEVVFNMFDEIIDRYLTPNGSHSIHIGLDEVYPLRGVDEEEPSRQVKPNCYCDKCKDKDWNELFLDYVVRLAKHLVEKGMTQIGMWHDSFVNGGAMNEALAERFRKEGLADKVILHWWRYSGFFDDIHPELGLKRWVVPMYGYYLWSPYRDHTDNIFDALKVGHEQGAEGTEAYGTYDRSFYRAFACLADYSWKKDGVGDLEDFRDKFNRFVFGSKEHEGRKAFKSFDLISNQMGVETAMLYYYTNAYAAWKPSAYIKENYPQAILEQFWNDTSLGMPVLYTLQDEAAKAKKYFEENSLWANDPADLKHIYPAECSRIIASAKFYMSAAQAVKAYRIQQAEEEVDAEKVNESVKALQESLTVFDSAMAEIETNIDHYLVPCMLREMTYQRDFLVKLIQELSDISQQAKHGKLKSLPDLECMKCHEVRWIE